jgi:hypothetical protein
MILRSRIGQVGAELLVGAVPELDQELIKRARAGFAAVIKPKHPLGREQEEQQPHNGLDYTDMDGPNPNSA